MAFDWKKTVAGVAPVIATALGGPLAGVAVKALSASVLGNPDAKESELAEAIASGGTDTLLKIKQAENQFQLDMQRIGVDLERIAADDRASARGRETALHDKTPAILAYVVTAGFFATLWYAFTNGMPREGGEALLIMLGSLGTAWTGVVSYYYGSSSGSARKDALLHKSTPVDR